jgi:hypothetical protein
MFKRIILTCLAVAGLGASVLVGSGLTAQSASACPYSHKQAHIT